MDFQELNRQFEAKIPVFERLKEEAMFILKSALDSTDIKVHSLDPRIKTFDSFMAKIKRKDLKKPFEEVKDIVGLRVVCLFLTDISRIGDVIRNSFEVLSEDNKIEGYESSSFGYLSVHFVAAMKKDYTGPRYDDIAGVTFEIQVRTISMHAWATISHYLAYKSEMDVPKELKRDFYALSGLFYVADTHFEMFFHSSQQSRKLFAELFQKAEPQPDQEINLDSLTAYLQKKFPDRRHSEPEGVSELVSELKKAGYDTIGDVEHAVDIAWDAFLVYEKERPPHGEKGRKFNDVGIVRSLFDLIDEKFSPGRSIKLESYRKLLQK